MARNAAGMLTRPGASDQNTAGKFYVNLKRARMLKPKAE
jgi:hypothetical protein